MIFEVVLLLATVMMPRVRIPAAVAAVMLPAFSVVMSTTARCGRRSEGEHDRERAA
jgi:hypothetical protein